MAAALLALVGAAPALANTPVQRFVAPGGATSANDCTNSANPCDFTHALMDVAQQQDEVILAAGLRLKVALSGASSKAYALKLSR